MQNTLQEEHPENTSDATVMPMEMPDQERIVVIGSGPVGMHFVQEMLQRRPLASIHVFGNEPFHPYNRVQLTAVLAGDVKRDAIDLPLPSIGEYPNFRYSVATVRYIDLAGKYIIDAHGSRHYFDKLVMATGARAYVPQVPGVEQTGVYTFRNLKDTDALYARVASSRHIVIVGGGLLGLEAAKGLLRFNTKITLVQQDSRLMPRQLDDDAAAMLQARVEEMGVEVITGSGLREVLGKERVTGARIHSGETLSCDTVVLCAGIQPNKELARAAGLKVRSGIVVDDQLQASHEDVYAIGECCEHQGQTYGLVNPGYEQAAVAADAICNGTARYRGSLTVSRLKVIGQSVSSMGDLEEESYNAAQTSLVYQKDGIYRRLILQKGRLCGVIAYGDWPELSRVQEAFSRRRIIWPWQRFTFMQNGRLWSDADNDDVGSWPRQAVVCQCNNIPLNTLLEARQAGCKTQADLQSATGAGSVCGSCKPLLAQLCADDGPREKEFAWLPILAMSLLAVLLSSLVAFWPEAKVSDSVLTTSWFEGLWNDKFFKQVTGFSLLGLSLIGLFMSLRKHLKWQWMGAFAGWRLAHIALGVGCAAVLIFHTGFHLGEQLNQLLMLNFLAVLTIGAGSAAVLALSDRLSPARAKSTRRLWSWMHILAVWPLPVLLSFHILSVYYF